MAPAMVLAAAALASLLAVALQPDGAAAAGMHPPGVGNHPPGPKEAKHPGHAGNHPPGVGHHHYKNPYPRHPPGVGHHPPGVGGHAVTNQPPSPPHHPAHHLRRPSLLPLRSHHLLRLHPPARSALRHPQWSSRSGRLRLR
eukprot:SM004175S15589  [mRNA]  locus=s4175:303:1244:+ [translate_table: standard]